MAIELVLSLSEALCNDELFPSHAPASQDIVRPRQSTYVACRTVRAVELDGKENPTLCGASAEWSDATRSVLNITKH